MSRKTIESLAATRPSRKFRSESALREATLFSQIQTLRSMDVLCDVNRFEAIARTR